MLHTIIFISIFIILYSSIYYYIFIRSRSAIAFNLNLKRSHFILFIILYFTSILGLVLNTVFYNPLSIFFYKISVFWFALMLYSFIFIIVIDIVRLLCFIFKIKPAIIKLHYKTIKIILLLTVFLVEMIIIVIGYQNTMNLKVTELDLRINKDAGRLESLNIVMISDIHINALTTKKKLRNIIKLINEQSPDIVLFVGDIVDTQIDPFNKQNLGTLFLAINSKYGIFAVTGNHEYIGDHIKTINSLSKYGVTFLRDDVIKIENSFYLVGREDLSAYRSLKKKRKSLKDLIVNNNKKYPILLMDHQPIDLDIASDNGIDLQMSGHTHNGQLFPFNLITDLLFELPWGYLKKGETHYYVSCGVGTAGIPLRTGSYPEIVNIKLIFNENKNSNKYISSSK